MAKEKRRTNYIITNKVKINDNRKVIENDLMNWINQKYIFCFKEHFEIKVTFKERIKKETYADGFDIGFDYFLMK